MRLLEPSVEGCDLLPIPRTGVLPFTCFVVQCVQGELPRREQGEALGGLRGELGLRRAEGGGSLGFGGAVTEAWTVPLPPDAKEPFEVYVNGVPQTFGSDYSVDGRTLRFRRPLAKEGRLGALRWLSIAFGVAGTYRKNDSVDVVFERRGRRVVASGLPIIPPGGRALPPSR